jgi:D-alanyl-lipoteichoic acid acyltransferase DltB (MBOAT superfamily)
MLFNSVEFLLFFPAFILVYFILPHRYRWFFTLLASLFFYMCYSPKYIFLLMFSTWISWHSANKIAESTTQQGRKNWLAAGIILNVLQLVVFKYLNFIDDNFRGLFELLGIGYPVPEPWFNNIILPVGISFFTFHTLAYTIDVYKGITPVERRFAFYTLFVAYWPQLLAGPIPRANQLIPELRKRVEPDYDRMRSGLIRMVIGMFKKVVIADRLSMYVKHVYDNYEDATGWTVLLGATMFVIQVYCDFSGYSDIAIGASRVMGIRLMENFKRPFFAKNLADFWTRWHISLSTWLTDYVFFYLGAYKSSGAKVVFNVIFVLTICGLWHGANWPMVLSFTIIGVMMAIRYLWQFNVIRQIKPSNLYKLSQKFLTDGVNRFITFFMLVIAFMLFRVQAVVESLSAQGIEVGWTQVAGTMYRNIIRLNEAGFLAETIHHKGEANFLLGIFFTGLLLVTEGITGDEFIEDRLVKQKRWFRWAVYLFMLVSIFWFGVFNESEFVYFQF